MTNVGIWSNHLKWHTHGLEYNVDVVPERSGADYISLSDAEIVGNIGATSSLIVEHELLHALEHLQFFLLPYLEIPFPPILTFIGIPYNFVAAPLATFDAPFRPPRFISLPI